MTKTQTKQEITTEKKSKRIFGCWINKDKNGNKYITAPLSAEYTAKLIEALTEYKETGCKILMFENTMATKDTEPTYVANLYPNESK